MSIKNLFYSFIVLATCSQGISALAKEESPRCIESKKALKVLEKSVFDETITLNNVPTTLRNLEIKKASLEAQKSILDTFSNIHKQREDFEKRLNPTNPNSFYSKNMDTKTAVQETQKQIISNYILTSITSSISAILEKDGFLDTSDEGLKGSEEWINAKDNVEKFRVLSDGNAYGFIKERCQELGLKGNSEDPCTNFTDVQEKALITLFTQTNQDMVGDVTNNFFKAYYTSKTKDNGIGDEALKKIQREQITKHVSIENLNSERTILLSSLLEKNEKDGLFDTENLSNFFKVNTINPSIKNFSDKPFQKRTMSSTDKYSVDSIKKMEDEFESAKKCFTKKQFGIQVDCSGEKSIANFFNKINDLDYKKTSGSGEEVEESLRKNAEVSKFNAKNIVKNIAQKELKTLDLLGSSPISDEEKFKQMKAICSSLKPLSHSGFAESLWNCVDKLNANSGTEEGLASKKSKLDSEITQVDADLQKARASSNNKYGNLVKYAAATAKEYCADTLGEYKGSCIGSDAKVTNLVFGDNENFLTNLDNIEWNLSGKKETEEILSGVNQQCSPILTKARQAAAATAQTSAKNTDSSIPNLQSLCTFAKNDLRNLIVRTPSEEQKEFRRTYTTKYNRLSGEMEYKKKTGIGTMVLKSAGTSLLNNGLPLYLQNSAFKNNLPYQTQMAIQQKNYMYMMNNPQYWSTSMFNGYGVSNPLNGYASSGYYNFGN
ncbi:hypothetical protein [Halobacteriovorax sp. JY17]|uniref:hypothetical protein n=1 Tax=Halobacteriovorax sp. JY17 TaxID=2014617 RepID=UPI000C64C00D|nr:hypothetical protein [Halobacteriovorax sp. JY17]PIK16085.1 MAG: hypothetical protein CES88_04965 [Halobacteriovorax sp. JY17]